MMFLLLVGISVSCDRFLDIKPKGIQIPEYYDDYLRLLNHKDMMYADAGFVSYITDDILLGDNSVPFGQFDRLRKLHRICMLLPMARFSVAMLPMLFMRKHIKGSILSMW